VNVEEDPYITAHPRSRALYAEQATYIPGGVTHCARALDPFPLFIERCSGSRKWDVDGHEYVDYWMGHGANLLGHSHPVIVGAVMSQLRHGFHAGGETELGLQWAKLICELVPSAEQVRFTASGSEATQLAIRLARAYTGKDRILKFHFHFHGWHDVVMTSVDPPFDLPMSAGIPCAVAQDVISIPCSDSALLKRTLDQDQAIAAIIVEPGGGHGGTVPVDPAFLHELLRAATDHGALLIFDEVVTGFRYAPGGAQEYYDVTPDLSVLGKIIGGGLSAGALAGPTRYMELLDARSSARRSRYSFVRQHGTWNANPIAAVAGVAALRQVAAAQPLRRAAKLGGQLRSDLNRLFFEHQIGAVAYGDASIWRTYLGPELKLLNGDFSQSASESELLNAGWGAATPSLRRALLLNGVDVMHTGGFLSSVHTTADLDRTVGAFDQAIKTLKTDRLI